MKISLPMTNKLAVLLCPIVLFGSIFASTLDAGINSWTKITPDGTVNALAIDPSAPLTVYAGTRGAGVFKSTNGGANWSEINSGLYPWVLTLAVDPSAPSTIYAGTEGGGVCKSTNGGTGWSAINTGLTGQYVYALAIDPSTPSNIYAGTRGGGVFKSTNGGANWSAINTGLTNLWVNALSLDPSAPSNIYAGTDEGVFKSTNGGANWSAINTGLTESNVYALAVDPSAPSTLYAGTWTAVFKSTNGGANWVPLARPTYEYLNVTALFIDPFSPATIYAGTRSGGVFKSTNGGTNWGEINAGITNLGVEALAIDPSAPFTIYAGTDGGVFKSTNGGENWSPTNAGLMYWYVNALAIDPSESSRIYAGTNMGVIKSANGGASWTTFNTLQYFYVNALAINPSVSSTIYTGTEWGTFKSTNSGGTWPNTGSLMGPEGYALAVDPSASSTVYAGTDEGVYKTINEGTNWNAINTGLTKSNVYALAIDPLAPSTIYAGTDGGIFKTTNGGTNWSSTNTGLTNANVVALAINPSAPSTIYAGTWGGGVFKTTVGGANWSPANTGLPSLWVNALVINPSAPSTIYAGTWGGGVFKSTNGGANWSEINTGLANWYVYALSMTPSGSTLYAGTGGDGVFKLEVETISTPNPPNGPMTGSTGTNYTYSTGGATSSLGHAVEYQFDWKGDESDLSPWGSGTQSKTWTNSGTYFVRSRARCTTDTSVISNISEALSVYITAVEIVSGAAIPSGPTAGSTGTSYTYSTGGAASSFGHAVEYQFDWKGDGSDTSPWGSAAQSKTWTSPGVYSVRARARCTTHTSVMSDFSSPLSVQMSSPSIETISGAAIPSGPTAGSTGTSYTYSTGGATSSLGHAVEYQFDWKGDESDLSPWGSATQSKTWTSPNTYNVRARARCSSHHDKISNWSNSLTVTIMNPPSQYTLSVNIVGSGTVTKNPNKSTYNEGEQVTLTAVSNSGYSFSGWSGDISGTANPTSITMNGNMNVTANFIYFPSIVLQSPLEGTHFSVCSLYSLPIFSWTVGETFKGFEIQFSLNSSFNSIPVKVRATSTLPTMTLANLKKIMVLPASGGGTIYWRVVGTRTNKTTFVSEVRSFFIEPPQPVEGPTISPMSKGLTPELFWKNSCNIKFKVWFGSDESLTKKITYSFNIINPNDKGGEFRKVLTSYQWKSIRKLVGDVSGSTIYWSVESWDGLKRYSKTNAMSFELMD